MRMMLYFVFGGEFISAGFCPWVFLWPTRRLACRDTEFPASKVPRYFRLAVSGEPVNDFIYLIFCAGFTDAFMDKERVDFREGHLISVLFLHHSSLLAVPIFRPDGFADRKDSFPK